MITDKVEKFIGMQMLKKGVENNNPSLLVDGLNLLFPSKFTGVGADVEIDRVYRSYFGFIVPKWEIDGHILGEYKIKLAENNYAWFWREL